jgi:hypothetical protein
MTIFSSLLKKIRNPYLVVAATAIVLALVPWLMLMYLNSGPLSAPPEMVDDSVYYFARVHTVLDGHIFIGNPYIKEYADGMTSAFFGADWIATIPFVFGLPFTATIIIDVVLWSAIFGIICVWFLQMLGMTVRQQVIGAIILIASSFWLLQRPVAMEVVFPIYMLFMGAYLLWLKNPSEWRRMALLTVSIILSFYAYTYLWQIVVITLACVHLFACIYDRRLIKPLAVIDFCAVVAVSPLVVYTYQQIHHAWYWETMARIGLIATHTVGSSAIYYAGIALVSYGTFFVGSRFRPKDTALFVFVTTISVALLGVTLSNIITGKDLEIAVHVGRFVDVWSVVLALWIFSLIASLAANTDRLHMFSTKKFHLLIAMSYSLLIIVHGAYGFLQRFPTLNHTTLASESYAEPLAWLGSHTPPGSIIFADDQFSYYVPVMTHDFVQFQPDAGLYLMSDGEVADRYLASRMFDALSLTNIENDYRLYGGVGNAIHAYKTENRRRQLTCLLTLKRNCAESTTAVSYRGESYFEGLYSSYQSILKNPQAELDRYGVNYIVIDSENDPPFTTENLPNVQHLATIGRFEIYSVH